MERQDVYNYLTSHVLAVLSTIDPEEKPYAATMFYIVDKKLNFYFFSRTHTRKIDNVKRSKNVAITVIDQEHAITVQAQGIIEEILDEEDRTRLIGIMGEHTVQKASHLWPPPIAKLPEGDLTILRVVPTWIRYGDYSKISTDSDGIFYQIEPQEK
ncbi:MAG: hypothetical protein RLZZ455_654 [Candidatus Parcubacteria bacterium]|jgi:general stress protein 26